MGATKKTAMEQRENEELSPWESKLVMDKISINQKVNHIISEVNSGKVNPLEAFIFLNFMQKVADTARKRLLDEAITEAEKYPEKEAELYDATVTVKNGAGRYTYPDSIKKAQEQAKLAYKASLDNNTITDDNGEIVEPATYKQGSTTLSITFK